MNPEFRGIDPSHSERLTSPQSWTKQPSFCDGFPSAMAMAFATTDLLNPLQNRPNSSMYHSPVSGETPRNTPNYGSPVEMGTFSSPSNLSFSLLQSQLLQQQQQQQQQQFQVLSQALLLSNSRLNNYSAPNLPPDSTKDPMLCFTLGEKLGALNKHEEMTRDTLKDINHAVETTTRDTFDVKSRQEGQEVLLQQLYSSTKQLREVHEQNNVEVAKVSRTLSVLERDLLHCKETCQTSLQKQDEMLKQIQSQIHSAETGLATKAVEVENIQRDLSRLTESIESSAEKSNSQGIQMVEVQKSVDTLTAVYDRDREETQRRLSSLQLEFSTSVESSANHTRQLEKRVIAAMQHELQLQISSIRSEIQTLSSSSASMSSSSSSSSSSNVIAIAMAAAAAQQGVSTGGLTSLFLHLFLPFLSLQRLQQIGSWFTGTPSSPSGLPSAMLSTVDSSGILLAELISSRQKKGITSLSLSRKLWTLLLFTDIAERFLSIRHPQFGATITNMLGLKLLIPSYVRWIIGAVRLGLEVGLVLQLAFRFIDGLCSLFQRTRERVDEELEKGKEWARSRKEKVRKASFFSKLMLACVCGALFSLVCATALAPLAFPLLAAKVNLRATSDISSVKKELGSWSRKALDNSRAKLGTTSHFLKRKLERVLIGREPTITHISL